MRDTDRGRKYSRRMGLGQGEGRWPGPCGSEHGYAMAALLVGLSIMAVLMSIALPVWSHQMKREREEELIWRGQQYARAIGLFQRKYANTFPPTIDVLVEQRFLRKKYKDPITNERLPADPSGRRRTGSGRSGTATALRTSPGWRRSAPGRGADDRIQHPDATRQRPYEHRHRVRAGAGTVDRDSRRRLQEQGLVDQDLQRPDQIQRVGVCLSRDRPACRGSHRGAAAWHATRRIPRHAAKRNARPARPLRSTGPATRGTSARPVSTSGLRLRNPRSATEHSCLAVRTAAAADGPSPRWCQTAGRLMHSRFLRSLVSKFPGSSRFRLLIPDHGRGATRSGAR